MNQSFDVRPGEHVVEVDPPSDAALHFIGCIHTPWLDRSGCPRQGRQDGPECQIEVYEPWSAALSGTEDFDYLEVLYWLDRARRDIVVQNPSRDDLTFGTFALRSPLRPNPIGTSVVRLIAREGNILRVRGLDCLDGTPLIDIKPDGCAFTPRAPAKAADLST